MEVDARPKWVGRKGAKKLNYQKYNLREEVRFQERREGGWWLEYNIGFR